MCGNGPFLDNSNTKSYSLIYKKAGQTVLKITYTKQARKTLQMMQPRTARRILTAIEKLAHAPARTDLDVMATAFGSETAG